MKSIGELKEADLERCSFNEIFIDYEDITPELKEKINEHLHQYVSQREKCIKCDNKLNGFNADVDDGDCGVCGWPGDKKHTVKSNGEEHHFKTLVLQIHPSYLRG